MNLDELLVPVTKTKKAPKILTLDIETSPHLVWSFDLWNANITPDKIVQPSRVLCFAAKWHGTKTVEFHAEWEEGGRDAMVAALWRLLNEADIVVHYNGARFDIPHIQRELHLAGLTPPSPFQQVDLLRVHRSQFKFASNRLGYVSEQIGIGTKLETGGWSLWQGVLSGDPAAQAKFKRYNIQDVRLTEQLLDALGPWIKNFPHVGMWTENASACYRCGGTDLTHQGAVYTKTAIYPKKHCTDCGAWNKVLTSGKTRAA